jgi:divalent metal cation (Fe/Co/Zn/Cd) transporter
VLLFVRVAVALYSGSLSLIVTMLDAVLDVISGFIIWTTSKQSARKDKYRFPIGQVHIATLTSTLRPETRIGLHRTGAHCNPYLHPIP